jgi:hypothetical protein
MITENIDYSPSLFRYVTDPIIPWQTGQIPLTCSAVNYIIIIIIIIIISIIITITTTITFTILITLLNAYLLGNLHLSQIVGGIRRSEGKEIHLIPQDYYYYYYYIIAYSLSGGGLLVSPDLNNRSKQLPQHLPNAMCSAH